MSRRDRQRRKGLWARAARLALLIALLVPVAATAQLGLPSLPGPLGTATRPLGPLTDTLDPTRLSPRALTRELQRARLDWLTDFVRRNRDHVEFDRDRNPAVRGILLATGFDAAMQARAGEAGFRLIESETIEGLDLSFGRFAVPAGMDLDDAEKRFARLMPGAEIEPDHIYFPTGSEGAPPAPLPSAMLAMASGGGARLGLIDGGVANHRAVAGLVEQRGFAKGAPSPSDHGTAVAALMIGKGSPRGGMPGGALLAADVYGRDPAGGSATAIARALGWLTQKGVSVVNISLAGPSNALLARAVSAAQAKGILIVAAVGNDGPAAPARYPAALNGVLGVTAVDRREKVLPEAVQGNQVDFAAPGSDFDSAQPSGGTAAVRGTSFASPLVAARLAYHYPAASIDRIEPSVKALMAEAKDLGKKGRDSVYGNGLVCENCVDR